MPISYIFTIFILIIVLALQNTHTRPVYNIASLHRRQYRKMQRSYVKRDDHDEEDHHFNATTTFAVGDMSNGQLGDGASVNDPQTKFPVRSIPVGIPPSQSAMRDLFVTKIIGGGATTYFLIGKEGRVFASGYNAQGQIGIGQENTDDQVVPVEVTTYGDLNGRFVIDVGAGNRHALFLDSQGVAYSTGLNNGGQLSVNDLSNRYVPTRVIVQPEHPQTEQPKIVNVEAGYYHSFFLSEEGGVWAAGSNDVGQCGTGSRQDAKLMMAIRVPPSGPMYHARIKTIAAGYYHSLFLSEEGEVFATGFGGYGQLATLSTESSLEPLAVSRIPGSPLNHSRITHIAAGAYFSIFLNEHGHIFSVGQNSRGMLGMGHVSLYEAFPYNMSSHEVLLDQVIIDVKVGHQFVLMLDEHRDLYHVGDNAFGQSGRNSPTEYFAEPSLTWTEVDTFGTGMSTSFIHEKIGCHDGFYWDFDSPDAHGCSECPEGRYCTEEYAYYLPRPCPDFQWAPRGSKSINSCSIEHCMEGYICMKGNRIACPPGEWSKLGDNRCSPCAPGMICHGNGIIEKDRSFVAFIQSPLGIVTIFSFMLLLTTAFMCCCVISVIVACVIRSQRVVRKKTDVFESLLQGYVRDVAMDDLNDDVQRVRLMVKESLLEIDFDELSIKEKIGSGGGDSVVFLASWNEMDVAVKLFKTTRLTGETFHEDFQKELGFMSSLRHPRLVSFYGCCLSYPRLGLVLEYCAKGSVASCIRKGYIRDMAPQQIYKILLEVCEGMIYLHKRGVIHRDLKCDNIFLTNVNDAKIADFGLSRHIEKVEETMQLTSNTGTSYYMAPEILRGESVGYDFKVDVYSFSILAVEICAGKMFPYPESEYTPIQAQMKAAIDPNFRPDLSLISDKFPELVPLLQRCWNVDPAQRPTFEDINEQLKELFADRLDAAALGAGGGAAVEKEVSRERRRRKSR